MAIKLINREWCAYADDFKCEFIMDWDADANYLPTSCTGSTALSVESGAVYIVNTHGRWVKVGG